MSTVPSTQAIAYSITGALVAACRDLFGDPGASVSQDAWPLQHPIAAVLLWSVAILAVLVPLATRRYQRIGR
ncbi:hypothetical protein [Streptosporangium saharense]|uniref:hypothetical protein n=1 Tax=Streptosporangium saharense TaxID=1706840 RepID=UPI0033332408